MINRPIYYIYPISNVVSFTLIAKKHIEYLRKLGIKIYEVDESQVTTFKSIYRNITIMQPLLYPMHKIVELRGGFDTDYFKWWREDKERLIGIDVCDSDKISDYAVRIANETDLVIVPSMYCKDVFIRSGVKTRVECVPHGLDPEWYTTLNVWDTLSIRDINISIIELFIYKLRKNKKVLLFWLWHSAWRKGWEQVKKMYEKLREIRDDVILVVKTKDPNIPEYQQVMHLGTWNIYGWLTEKDKMALYDLADINLMFSIGGAFEMNCLEALARGVPCIASNRGPWTEYLPPFLQVKTKSRVQPLPGNIIYTGYGYTVDVDDALEKVLNILDNLDEYKAKVMEYREKVLKNKYRWDIIARKLKEIITE